MRVVLLFARLLTLLLILLSHLLLAGPTPTVTLRRVGAVELTVRSTEHLRSTTADLEVGRAVARIAEPRTHTEPVPRHSKTLLPARDARRGASAPFLNTTVIRC